MPEKGNTYALVMVDHFTYWPVIYAVDNIEADTVAKKVHNFIHICGCPESLLSDRESFYHWPGQVTMQANGSEKDLHKCLPSFFTWFE